jgi:hypothetical protein
MSARERGLATHGTHCPFEEAYLHPHYDPRGGDKLAGFVV